MAIYDYLGTTVSAYTSVKDFGAKGDGVTTAISGSSSVSHANMINGTYTA